MENCVKSKNIFYLIGLYLKDTLQVLFRHPFLQKRRNRWAVFLSVLLGYFLYFYLNVVEYARLLEIGSQYSFEELRTVISLSVGSYNSLAFVAGIFIFLLTNSTVTLKSHSLFLSKVLPFSEKEVYLSVKFFKLAVGLGIFELFYILLMPGLGVLQSLPIAIALFFSCHFVFLTTYLLINCLYVLAIKYFSLSERIVQGIVISLSFLLGLFYLFVLRFPLEFFLARFIGHPLTLSLLLLLLSLACLMLLFIFDREHHDFVFLRYRFLRIPVYKFLKGHLKWSILAIIRTKFFLYSILFAGIAGVYFLSIADLEFAAHQILKVLPLLSISLVHYADSTVKHRKLYPHLSITVIKELIYILATVAFFQIPALLLTLYLQESMDMLIQSSAICLISLIVGFLFPRSANCTNETVSSMLLLLATTLLYFLLELPMFLVPVTGLLVILLAYIMKKETELRL